MKHLRSLITLLPLLGLVYIFYMLVDLSFYRESQVNWRYKNLYTAWYDGDFATAVEEGEVLASQSFIRKQIGRMARAELGEDADQYMFSMRWLGKILHYFADWRDYMATARVHMNISNRDIFVFYILSLIKEGNVEKGQAAFEDYLVVSKQLDPSLDATHPVLSPNRTFVDEVLAGFFQQADDPAAMARIDVMNLFLSGKTGAAVTEYGPSPWGAPYEYYFDPKDPLNIRDDALTEEEKMFFSVGDFDPRDPEKLMAPPTQTYFLSTRAASDRFFTFSLEDTAFSNLDPSDYFLLLSRIKGLEASYWSQTPGTVTSALLYTMANPDAVESQKEFVPFFFRPDDGSYSTLWLPFLEYVHSFVQQNEDWYDRVQVWFSNSDDDYPIHEGNFLFLIRFQEGDGLRDWVLPYLLGDPSPSEGPSADPKERLAPPPDDVDVPTIAQKIIERPDHWPGAEETLALTKFLLRSDRFETPLQAHYANGYLAIFPRQPEALPTWILAKKRAETKQTPREIAARVLEGLRIPPERLSTNHDASVVRTSNGDVAIHLLTKDDVFLLYFTSSNTSNELELAQDLLNVLSSNSVTSSPADNSE